MELSQARLEFLRQETKVAVTRRSTGYSLYRANEELQDAKDHVRRHERRLKRRKEQRDNMNIRSPASGLICYNKVYSGGMFSKVSLGTVVGPRFSLLSIPDLSRMYVTVEVPEKYYSRVTMDMPVDVKIPALSDAAPRAPAQADSAPHRRPW